jgi:uncharacterized membrane protein
MLDSNASQLPKVRAITLGHCWQWLRRGWQDTFRSGLISWLHGIVVTAFGLALWVVAREQFWLLAGACSGFLIVAPVLATSLYSISRAFEKNKIVSLSLIAQTWADWQHSRHLPNGNYWSVVRFSLLLALAGTVWVLTSASFVTLFSPAQINTPQDFLNYIVLAQQQHIFEIWLILGGLMAAPIFASSVVSIPLLLDRHITVMGAVLTSWQAVLRNPSALALWAAIMMLLTVASFAIGMIGLVLVVPLLGHASWHAYRDLVDASALPERSTARLLAPERR